MKPKKVLLLGATLDSDNRGIGALAMGALSILLHRYPGCEISFVDYDRERRTTAVNMNGQDLSVPLINLRFSWKPWLANNIALLLMLAALSRLLGPALGSRLVHGNPWLKQIREADIAVAVSGGDSFSDIYGLGRFFYMTLPQLLMILMRRPLVLLPQTIGPMRSRLAVGLARYIISHSRVSYSRDIDGVGSTIKLLHLGRSSGKVRFCYDMGFLLEPRRPGAAGVHALREFTDLSRPLVGVNVSGLLHMGGYTRSNMFSLKCDYRTLIEELLEFLIDAKQANVVLVPHVFGAASESDIPAIEEVYAKAQGRYAGRLARVTQTLDQSEIKYVIGQCELFIGSRMHACIAALSQAVPAVSIAYSQKFVGVLGSVGAGHWVADPRTLRIEEVLRMVEQALGNRERIRSELQASMPGVKREVLNVLAAVA